MKTLVAFLLAIVLLPGLASARQSSFELGVEAYRRGDAAEAKERWSAALTAPETELDAEGRARVYFNLGNACWRLGEALPAIACYATALRLDPRHAAARENLELARAKEKLPPADPGDLSSTVRRVLSGLRPAEQRLLLLSALVLWTGVLLLEVWRGGTALRAGLALASLVLFVAALPWAYARAAPTRAAPLIVVAGNGAMLRSEPLEACEVIGELPSLAEVEQLDELPGWVRVQRDDGLRAWARADAFLALRLGNDAADGAARSDSGP